VDQRQLPVDVLVRTVAGAPVSCCGVQVTVDGGAVSFVNLDQSGHARLVLFYGAFSSFAGTHVISASYVGTAALGASSASSALIVGASAATQATETTLVSSANPLFAGQPVIFTASVTAASGTPAGSVTFTIDGTAVATVTLSSGQASYSTSTLSVGDHTIKAGYSTSGGFAASSSTLAQTITEAPTSTSFLPAPDPSAFGTSVLLTATVTQGGVAVSAGNVT